MTAAVVSVSTGKTINRPWFRENSTWNPEELVERLTADDRIYLPVLEFSAAAEHSTRQAFMLVKDGLERELNQSQSQPEIEFIQKFIHWLNAWVIEEDRHVRFFSMAFGKLSAEDFTGNDQKPKVDCAKIRPFGIESPIPEMQHWHTTLLFLMFSEITSMLWYRKFFRHPTSPALKEALRFIHGDETNHYGAFLDSCCQMSSINPLFCREARRVFAAFLFSNKRFTRFGNEESSHDRVHGQQYIMNWWEHPAFTDFVPAGELIGLANQAIRLQRYSLNRISMASTGARL